MDERYADISEEELAAMDLTCRGVDYRGPHMGGMVQCKVCGQLVPAVEGSVSASGNWAIPEAHDCLRVYQLKDTEQV